MISDINNLIRHDRVDQVIAILNKEDELARQKGTSFRVELVKRFTLSLNSEAYKVISMLLSRYPLLASSHSIHYNNSEGRERSALNFFMETAPYSIFYDPFYSSIFEKFLELSPTFEPLVSEIIPSCNQTPLQRYWFSPELLSTIKKVYDKKVEALTKNLIKQSCALECFPVALITLISSYAKPAVEMDKRIHIEGKFAKILGCTGCTPLGAAIFLPTKAEISFERRKKAVQLYLELGANPNLQLKEDSPETIFEYAKRVRSPYLSILERRNQEIVPINSSEN